MFVTARNYIILKTCRSLVEWDMERESSGTYETNSYRKFLGKIIVAQLLKLNITFTTNFQWILPRSRLILFTKLP